MSDDIERIDPARVFKRLDRLEKENARLGDMTRQMESNLRQARGRVMACEILIAKLCELTGIDHGSDLFLDAAETAEPHDTFNEPLDDSFGEHDAKIIRAEARAALVCLDLHTRPLR